MMFANGTEKSKNVLTARYDLADGKFDGSVCFSISQNRLFFV